MLVLSVTSPRCSPTADGAYSMGSASVSPEWIVTGTSGVKRPRKAGADKGSNAACRITSCLPSLSAEMGSVLREATRSVPNSSCGVTERCGPV